MSGLRTDILTSTGNYFNFADLESNVIDIQDIAQGLSNVCRFAGQCPFHYSVAQHSVLVVNILKYLGVTDRHILMQGLLHDASEALTGDMTTPLKRLLPDFRSIEDPLQAHILHSFGLSMVLHETVKRADLQALLIEKRDVWHNTDPWLVLVNVPMIHSLGVFEMTPRRARNAFMLTYDKLRT